MDSIAVIRSLGNLANSPHSTVFGDQSPSAFFLNLLSIILIDIVLSGDNSVVIAMAVHSLPAKKRMKGILLGTLGAVILRVFFTLIAAHLLQVPFIKLAGGLAILWIAVKLLLEEAEAAATGKPIETIWHAVWIILIADFTMSLDNVLAVAGISKGDTVQLWLSLGFSIPLVVFASALLSKLMDKYPIILILGACMLGKVGGEMIFTDPVLTNWFKMESGWLKVAFEILCVIGVLGIARLIETQARSKKLEKKNS